MRPLTVPQRRILAYLAGRETWRPRPTFQRVAHAVHLGQPECCRALAALRGKGLVRWRYGRRSNQEPYDIERAHLTAAGRAALHEEPA